MVKSSVSNIMEAVRLLAALYPDAVYKSPGLDCLYTEGKVIDGPPSNGCIIGQAARLVRGFEDRFLAMCVGDSNSYGKGCTAYTHGMPESVRSWCRYVQGAQDNGMTWSNAVQRADNHMGYRKEVAA